MPSKKPFEKKSIKKDELVAVRLHPKLRFGLRLLARRWGGMTVSGAITSAIRNALRAEEGKDHENLQDLVERVWHPDQVTRFLNLAQCGWLLMSPDGKRMWEEIKSTRELFNLNRPNVDAIRSEWPTLVEKHGYKE